MAAQQMRVGVLLCDHLDPEVAAEHGDYAGRYTAILAPRGFEVAVVDLTAGEFPGSPTDCDAWLIGGSRLSAWTDDAFIPRLVDFAARTAARGVPQVGICFGHQVLARALGGAVEPAAAGWGLGARRWDLTTGERPGWIAADATGFSLIASHRDQVIRVPDGATVLASADYCPVAAFSVDDHVFCVQGHPEFDAPLSATLATRRRGSIDDEVIDAALGTLDSPLDRDLVNDWIAAFLAGP